MKYWLAFRNIVLILLVALAAEGMVWVAVNFTSAVMIVPQSKTVAAQFSGAMAAHRWSGALQLLNQDLRQQLKEEDLRQLMKQVESNQAQIERVDEQSEQQQADTATAVTRFTFTGQKQLDVTYSLTRENHLWKISGLEGLRALAAAP